MNRSTLTIVGALLLSAIIIAGVYFFVVQKDTDEQGDVGVGYKEAPAFSLPDAKGSIVSLAEIEADIKIVNFWASWSPYSADELKAFNRIQSEYGGLVSVVALSRDTHPEDGKRFLIEKGIENNITFVYDRDDAYYKKVDGFAVPETLFLNEKGEIVKHQHGPITYEEIRFQVEEMKK